MLVSCWYTPDVSRLIVNADDLGYTSGIDRAILELHHQRALSSATAMATGDSTHAGAAAWGSAGLSVGGHIVLVDGVPVSSPGSIPTLLAGGRFRASLGQFVFDLARGRISEREIEREALAQIRVLQTYGLRLTHVDTHKHTHMFGHVLRPLLRAAVACGVDAVRNPFEPDWAVAATAGAPALRRLQVRLLALGRSRFMRHVDQAGVRTTAGALGVLATGTLDPRVLSQLLAALERHGRDGETYELVCHPGFQNEELARKPTRLQGEREREHTALRTIIPQWTMSPDRPHSLANFANL